MDGSWLDELDDVNRCDELVTDLLDRLDEHRFRRVVAKRLPDLADAVVQALIEFDKRRRVPDGALQFLARDDVTGAVDQNGQHSGRLRLQTDAAPIFQKCGGLQVQLETSKPPPTALSVHADL
jgi:hypothetical protein